MAEIGTATVAGEQIHKTFSSPKDSPSDGILKGTNGKEHDVFAYKDTGSISKGVSEFLGEMNFAETPESLQFKAEWLTPAEIQLFTDIQQILQELEQYTLIQMKQEGAEENELTFLSSSAGNPTKTEPPRLSSAAFLKQGSAGREMKKSEVTYSSVFSMAKALSLSKNKLDIPKEEIRKETSRTEARALNSAAGIIHSSPREILPTRSEREKEKENGKQDKGQDQKQDQEKEQKEHSHFVHEAGFSQKQESRNKKQNFSTESIQAAKSTSTKSKSKLPSVQGNAGSSSKSSHKTSGRPGSSVDNIYIRFMALMARILGQAEAEAHELYKKIKHRTDDIDILTHFLSKVNSTKGKIDWSKDEEMKQLLEKVRSIGVDIPVGKVTWTEDEKKMLKENVQMKKDSMEKITQLERTDMQRYLQEASQCHQARSNILKLLKEVTDTIIANMRQ